MNDVVEDWRAPAVGNAELRPYFAEVVSLQKMRARSSERKAKAWARLFGAAMAANIALGFGVAAMLPFQRLVPLYLWVRPDGTVDSAQAVSSLPATQAEAVVRAALWQYTRYREGFDWASARYAYSLVSLMSAPDTRSAYQRWFLSSNPTSPQNMVGRKGQIDVELIAMTELRPGVALVRYRTIVTLYGETSTSTTHTATIQYTTADGMTPQARLLDPGGLLVTRYSSAEDSPNP